MDRVTQVEADLKALRDAQALTRTKAIVWDQLAAWLVHHKDATGETVLMQMLTIQPPAPVPPRQENEP